MEFNELNEEMKAKALACETPEDIIALAKEEGYELSDEELDTISGGWRDCDNYGCGIIGH